VRYSGHPVKKIFILLAAAVVALVMAFIFQPDPSVRFDAFGPRLREAFRHVGYRTLAGSSCGPERVPLPFWIEWHPRRWHWATPSHFAIGFPNSAVYFTVTRDGSSRLQCLVRYLDARAVFIDIRAPAAQQPAAAALRSTLAGEFPGLPIRMTSL
jgi:hypothetical protein